MAGFLAIVALPIPFLAVSGLSLPLPSSVASIASGLVPGASDPATTRSAAPAATTRRADHADGPGAGRSGLPRRPGRRSPSSAQQVTSWRQTKPHAAPKPHPRGYGAASRRHRRPAGDAPAPTAPVPPHAVSTPRTTASRPSTASGPRTTSAVRDATRFDPGASAPTGNAVPATASPATEAPRRRRRRAAPDARSTAASRRRQRTDSSTVTAGATTTPCSVAATVTADAHPGGGDHEEAGRLRPRPAATPTSNGPQRRPPTGGEERPTPQRSSRPTPPRRPPTRARQQADAAKKAADAAGEGSRPTPTAKPRRRSEGGRPTQRRRPPTQRRSEAEADAATRRQPTQPPSSRPTRPRRPRTPRPSRRPDAAKKGAADGDTTTPPSTT